MWKIHETCIYFDPLTKLDAKSDKYNIALFDMDGTLTTSASGRNFVVEGGDPDDWVYLGYVIDRLQSYKDEDWIVAIVSNQAKYNKTIGEKFESIRSDLEKKLGWSPYILIATKNDKYRKPDIGMPLFLLQLLGIDKSQVENFAMSGDMVAKDNPFPPFRIGTVDYDLSINIDSKIAKCDFYLPTEMFGANFDDDELLSKKVIGPEVILLVGNQGSGKSTLAKKYSLLGYKIVNQDQLTTKVKVLKKIKEIVSVKEDLIIDATHPSKAKRDEMLLEARKMGYHVRILWLIRDGRPFDATRDHKMHPAAYANYSKTFQRPTSDEGEVIQIY
jgi:DNA 3'-phosphatase